MQTIILQHLSQSDYMAVWQAMRQFTTQRDNNTKDELWFVEHAPVFTQGLAGKPEHIIAPGNIPVIQTDRGGQVTYHGPGQLVVYTLLDLRRLKLSIRQLVCNLEQAIVHTLVEYGIQAKGDRKAPGVYINDAKIGSIGLRVRRGCSYHGLAFNINMDLEPFSRINPCGFKKLNVTQLSEIVGPITLEEVKPKVVKYLIEIFNFKA